MDSRPPQATGRQRQHPVQADALGRVTLKQGGDTPSRYCGKYLDAETLLKVRSSLNFLGVPWASLGVQNATKGVHFPRRGCIVSINTTFAK